jgi:hypothetical protein
MRTGVSIEVSGLCAHSQSVITTAKALYQAMS